MQTGAKFVALTVLLAAIGCERGTNSEGAPVSTAEGLERTYVSSGVDWDDRLSPEALERGRLDPAWSRGAEMDTAGLAGQVPRTSEAWDEITPEAVNVRPMQLPLFGDVSGPSVVRAQILLDRVLFSPGIIDGHWGKNTEKAVYWFQARQGLPRTGRVDEATYRQLRELAAAESALIEAHLLTDEDLAGPFVTIPEDIYAKAELSCLCYESVGEKLAERFHTSTQVLEQLNPGINLNELSAGSTLWVPAVRGKDTGRDVDVARVVVSGEGFYVHALDASGRILFHFPSTLGSTYDPSPEGRHRIVRITRDPWWHYQPSLLPNVDAGEPEAHIPPGPNNAVGLVWMALSIPHYGIHGTAAPETIGYTTSAGCVRLTNWDAVFLSDRIRAGTAVEFTGTRSVRSAG